MNFRELFEIEHQWKRDGVERAIRLTTAHKIHMRDAIGKGKFAVAGESIEHERESLVTFDSARTFEVFIETRADQILG